MHIRILFGLATLLLLTSHSRAQLQWDNLVQQFQRTPQDEGLEARFTFRNTGAKAVTIKSLRASCGCTTPRLEKETYVPGEAGAVVARFVFGDRKGPQRKTMEVRTDDDSAAAKTIQLTAEAGQPVRIKRVIASNPWLAAG